MGSIISVVAVLDVSSVRKVMTRLMIRITIKGCNEATPAKWLPTHRERPLSLNPVARANPPPKRRRILHGNFTALSQSIIIPLFPVDEPPLFPAGIINSIIAIKIATVPSLIYLDSGKIPDHPGSVKPPNSISALKIHNKASRENITNTIFCSLVVLPISFSFK
ncbi:hypothetical protein SDC9_124615 [bioreactor metagenome]|uniref:Uncharacterized protein n=1 Tax=bioreactor metagenome TaxID=1076179 RepID=A0A645CL10_9ZZZZ